MLKKIILLLPLLLFSLAFTHSAHAVTFKITLHKYTYLELLKIEKEYGGKHKAEVINNLKIVHNDLNGKQPVLPVPLDPVGSFHGRLKKLGTIKIVFGVAGNRIGTVIETFGTIYYILRYAKLHHEKVTIAVVFYGVVSLLMNNTDRTVASFVRKFSKEGVKFYVCYNAMLLNNLVRAVLIKGVRPVPMGNLKMYELRKRGYMYFTNP